MINFNNERLLKCSSFSDFKAYVAEVDQQLNENFYKLSITELLQLRAEMFDGILAQLWSRFELTNEPISLNSVGGYGRARLHPKSDIDICVIYDQKLTTQQEQKVSAFLTKLWDLGVDIGHAVRSVADSYKAAVEDVTIATNLLDIRTLVGPVEHAKQVVAKLYQNNLWTSQTFFEHKIAEQSARHEKAHNTALYLEPNLKSNPGGLRDVQTIIWVARKHFDAADEKSLKTLGFLKSDEYAELTESYDFICRVRWALHSVANRAEERLLFDHQVAVAKFMKFGYGNNAQLAVEKMMRQLFRAMTRIRELNQMIIDVFKQQIIAAEKRSKHIAIDEQFSIVDDMIEANYDEVFINKKYVLTLFRYIAEYDQIKSIAPETLRLLRRTRRSLLGELQDYQDCREEFLTIIQHPKGLELAFSLMHRYGIIASYFPEWRAIEGQMQFDMHNAYTVDEHAFKLIQNLHAFNSKQTKKNLASTIFKSFRQRHLLVIAGLCHELSGKQSLETDKLSSIHAENFAQLHLTKKSEIDLVTWLVKAQDLLINTIQHQDLQSPRVIEKLAKEIGSEVKLNALYCFTVADLMATNDDMWNDWQESLINQLYFSIIKVFKHGVENVFELRSLIRENKVEARTLLVNVGLNNDDITRLWKPIPSAFFSGNQVEEIVSYTEALIQRQIDSPAVLLSTNNHLSCTTLFVYAQDRSMLFVDIFNTLTAAKLAIKDAQIMKTKDGYVIEIIKLLERNGEAIDDVYREQQIQQRIESVLKQELNAPKVKPARQINHFDTEPNIEFLPTPKKNCSLLRVNSLDNPHFIEKICQVFKENQLTIHSAKMSTIGECSDNVFLVSNNDNAPISEDHKEQLTDSLRDKIA